MKRRFAAAGAFAIAGLLALSGLAGAAAGLPVAVSLSNLPGGASSSASAVNDAGQIVGWATTAAGDQHAVVWQGGQITDLGTLPGDTSSYATAISHSGLIVGVSGLGALAPFDPANEHAHAVLWQKRGPRGTREIVDLGTLPGGSYSTATGVNDRGQVVGYSRVQGLFDLAIHGFLWQDGQMIDLRPLQASSAVLSSSSTAAGINSRGQIVGNSASFDLVADTLTRHATMWQNGIPVDLGAVPADAVSIASAINEAGQITGSSGTIDPDLAVHATIWSGLQAALLVRPVGERFSSGLSINDRGDVVGQCATETDLRGCHWTRNAVTFLVPRPGEPWSTAFGINNRRLAVGYSQDSAGTFRAVAWMT